MHWNRFRAIREEEKTELKKTQTAEGTGEHRDKLGIRLPSETLQKFLFQDGQDATFMRMKEDAMRNRTDEARLQATNPFENQFITICTLPEPTDTLTLIPFLQSFSNRYDRMAHTVVAEFRLWLEESTAS